MEESAVNTAPLGGETEEGGAREARVVGLFMQAQAIEKLVGINVLDVFERDEEAHAKVMSGEWDFGDVAQSIMAREKRAPMAVRSANGASARGRDVRGMSDAEFDRLNEQLSRGYAFEA